MRVEIRAAASRPATLSSLSYYCKSIGLDKLFFERAITDKTEIYVLVCLKAAFAFTICYFVRKNNLNRRIIRKMYLAVA